MTAETVQGRLRRFTEDLLVRRGALVDWPASSNGDGGVAVVPEDVAEVLGCGEDVSLCSRPDGEGLAVNLATDFLERVVPLVEAEPNTCPVRIESLYLKQSDMARPVADSFTWHNAKVDVRVSQPTRVEYHTWFFHAALSSEDRWEDVVALTLNSQSGAEIQIPDPLDWGGAETGGLSSEGKVTTFRKAALGALAQIDRRSIEFVARMESRLERDKRRLREFYGALVDEERRKRERSRGAGESPEDFEAKKRAVNLELRRKLAEMEERYAIHVELAPLCLIRTDLPALAVRCEVLRKKAARIHTLYWNSLTKSLEPICCSRCQASTFSVIFSDDTVDPLCPACGS